MEQTKSKYTNYSFYKILQITHYNDDWVTTTHDAVPHSVDDNFLYPNAKNLNMNCVQRE